MSEASTILVATDFSAHARHAMDRAARLAEASSSALALMHVMPGSAVEQVRGWVGLGTAVETQLVEEARQHLQAWAQAARDARGVVVDPVVKVGSVLGELLGEADERDARLIVLGARGLGFMRRLALGSTAERLMQRASRPLLVVRQTPHEAYRRVLVALDFSPWSAQALAAAMWVAPQARFVLASVFEVPFEAKLRLAGVSAATVEMYRQQARADATRRVHAMAEQAGLAPGQWEPCVVEGDATFKLVEMEQEHDCDLVVLGKHGTSIVVDTLLGSVTRHVLSEGTADVLISTRRSD